MVPRHSLTLRLLPLKSPLKSINKYMANAWIFKKKRYSYLLQTFSYFYFFMFNDGGTIPSGKTLGIGSGFILLSPVTGMLEWKSGTRQSILSTGDSNIFPFSFSNRYLYFGRFKFGLLKTSMESLCILTSLILPLNCAFDVKQTRIMNAESINCFIEKDFKRR